MIRLIRLFKNWVLLAARDSDWAAGLLNRPVQPEEASPAVWQEQYQRGYHEHLWRPAELARHNVIAGYFGRSAAGGAVLDVGCGEGALQPHLRVHGYRRYLGIDVAPEAIREAQRFASADTSFQVADAGHFLTNEKFDAIVFNEMLYYFSRPLELMQRYQACLADSGVFIVSNCLLRRSVKLCREIGKIYEIEDEVAVVNRSGILWVIQLVRPPR